MACRLAQTSSLYLGYQVSGSAYKCLRFILQRDMQSLFCTFFLFYHFLLSSLHLFKVVFFHPIGSNQRWKYRPSASLPHKMSQKNTHPRQIYKTLVTINKSSSLRRDFVSPLPYPLICPQHRIKHNIALSVTVSTGRVLWKLHCGLFCIVGTLMCMAKPFHTKCKKVLQFCINEGTSFRECFVPQYPTIQCKAMVQSPFCTLTHGSH